MMFKERMQACIDEIVEDIFKTDINFNAEYKHLKAEAERLQSIISDGCDDEMGKLFDEYKGIIHAMAVIELRCVYENGLRHGTELRQ